MVHTPQEKKFYLVPVQFIETHDGIILKRGCTELKIKGKDIAKVLQHIVTITTPHGATRAEISERFAAPNRLAIQKLIEKLIAQRLLMPLETGSPHFGPTETKQDIFYWHFESSAGQVEEELNKKTFVIMGVNAISRQLATALRASGLTNLQVIDHPLLRNASLYSDTDNLKTDGWPQSLPSPLDFRQWSGRNEIASTACLIATSEFGGQQVMGEWNRVCVQYTCHFLPVVLYNLIGSIGPLVIPGETACFECHLSRQNSHLRDPEAKLAAERSCHEAQHVVGYLPSMASILGDMAAVELLKLYSGVLPNRKVGTLIEVNLLATKLTARKVLKIPHCSVCSPQILRSSTALTKEVFVKTEPNES